MSDACRADRMPVTTSMLGKMGPKSLDLLMQLSSGRHHNAVPLIGERQFEEVLGGSGKQFLLDGVAACTMNVSAGDISLDMTVVPGKDMGVREFLELAVDLVAPHLPDELTVPPQAFEGAIEAGTLAISGVGLWVNRNDPTVGLGMLYVPKSFGELAQPHPEYPVQEFATDIAAGIFYTAATASLAAMPQE
jgi:hypothetical protein